MEGLALTGAWVDREQGLVSTIVLEMGGSSDLCALLKPGEPVVLMGPTGTPTEIAGGRDRGAGRRRPRQRGAVLDRRRRSARAGSKVLYFAGYKKMIDRYKVAEIEAAADVVVWCCDEAPGFAPTRPQDRAFVGNIVQAMAAYATGALGAQPIPFAACDRIIAIGSDRMMAAVGAARHDGARAVPQAGPPRDRLDQLADAVHDEGDLRAVPAAAPRSGDRQGQLRVLLLQPGPAARPRRLSAGSPRA